MKIFATKFCLTDGIQELEADEPDQDFPHMAVVRSDVELSKYFHKGEWFKTRGEAVENANLRVSRKIMSLKKQLAKLQAMKFE